MALGACGGDGTPTSPSTPPPPTFSVSVVVFYDENANGRLDADEEGRLPGVVVDVGGRTAMTEMRTGRARVTGILGGARTARVRSESLPLFWVAGDGVPVDVPTERELELPVQLPIGDNTPNLYMAFGDSITEGDGSSDGRGYVQLLEDRLQAGFGVGEVIAEGVGGTFSDEGAARLGGRLNRNRPAFTLILYGTNDWNPCDDVASCFTLESLGSMIAQVKARNGLPVVATIPPVNVGFDPRAPASRNDWVAEANVLIRALARSEGAQLADVEKVLLAAANGNFAQLFVDHVHPNDRGYEIIADEFYRALSSGRATSNATTALALPTFGPRLELPSPQLRTWSQGASAQREQFDLGGARPRRVRAVTGPLDER